MLQSQQQTLNNYGVKHLAVIMDGNRRWAKARNLPTIEGHTKGVDALKALVRSCPDFGIEYLTVYAFSTENWKRPEPELNFLFRLLAEVAIKELDDLNQNNVKVSFIGDIYAFKDPGMIKSLENLKEKTKDNTGLNLQIALNYGSVDELTRACQRIKASLSTEEIRNLKPVDFSKYLDSSHCPDPELIIRTGGQQRLSNYLLWQAASANLAFVDELWPDFNESCLSEVLKRFAGSVK